MAGQYGDTVKIALQAPAVDGKANKALVAFLASLAGIPKSHVTILRGDRSRDKTVLFQGLTAREIEKRLAAQGVETATIEGESG